MIIDGSWRESTPAERARLGFVLIRCAVHEFCDARAEGCVQRMQREALTAVGVNSPWAWSVRQRFMVPEPKIKITDLGA